MTTGMIVGLVVGGSAIVVVLLVITIYNQLVRFKALVDEAWSGIDVQLKRRYDLLPNLVSVVKGYSIHEKTVLEDVTRMRSAAMNATSVQSKSEAEADLTRTLKTLFAVAENYPNLKANENFISLQKEMGAIEHEIQLSRRYYNGAARNYNIAVAEFPSRIIAGIAGFHAVAYFELSASHERDVPKIQF